MKVEDMMKVLGIAASAFLLLVSCIKEEPTVLSAGLPETVGDPVSVTISLSTSDVLAGTSLRTVNREETTKAPIDIEDETCIQNLWVAQYGGTDDSAPLLAPATYIDSLTYTQLGQDIRANLSLVGTDSPSTIVLIANTCDKSICFPKTLGGMSSFQYYIDCEDRLFGFDGTYRHIIFSGTTTPSQVIQNQQIIARLTRNVAKVNLMVVNETFNKATKVTINSLKLESVPGVSRYLPSYGNPSTSPADDSFSTIDYPSKNWNGSGNQDTAVDSSLFTFYVPVNKRGTVVNSEPKDKAVFRPSYATLASIKGTYLFGSESCSIKYEFYLGANLVNDFNLEANKEYNYRIVIKEKGSATTDSRVKDFTPIVFTQDANCYIINPPDDSGDPDCWRVFSIPITRINTFWGGGDYQNNPNNCLDNNSQWTAYVIWSDFDHDNSQFRFSAGSTTLSGTGTNNITFQVRTGARGNAVIGLKRQTSGGNWTDYIWSWHLWITDYHPDEALTNNMTPIPSVYDYAVSGGHVQRMEGSMWQTGGLYQNSFLMDRNIGALDISRHDYSDPGVLYYQFGRKDPFWYPRLEETATHINHRVSNSTIQSDVLDFSVANPDTFIMGSTFWLGGVNNKYNNTTSGSQSIIWQDPTATSNNQGSVPANHQKSLFDPCPPGWKIPEKDSYIDLSTQTAVRNTLSKCVEYRGAVVFPCFSRINGSDGALYTYYFTSDPHTYLWNSTVYSAYQDYNSGWKILFPDSSVTTQYFRSFGCPVRCVSE